jgi:hypothetical protein
MFFPPYYTQAYYTTFVTALVSLPKYVNLDQCVFSVPLLCFLELDTDLRTDVLYPLLCRISSIIFLSFRGIAGSCSIYCVSSVLLHTYVRWCGRSQWVRWSLYTSASYVCLLKICLHICELLRPGCLYCLSFPSIW